MKRTTLRDRLVPLAVLLILLTFGALVARKFLVSPPPVPVPAVSEPKQRREVILYFAAPQGTYLVAEAREIEGCLEETECLQETVQALVHGPVSELLPILPEQALLRGVSVADGSATVDFSRELVDAHPGGSVSELLTVYGLADTLAANFPQVRQVRILVEGAPVETLKGHVDLRQPIRADLSFTRPPEGSRGGEAGAAGQSGAPDAPAGRSR